MELKLMEKTVSNIFTNLLNLETHLTSAKVQAIAETAINYAFILCDAYKYMAGPKVDAGPTDMLGLPREASPQGLPSICTCTKEACSSAKVECKKEVKREIPKEKKVAVERHEEEEDIFDELKDIEKEEEEEEEEVQQPVKRPRGRPKGFSPKKKQNLR